MGIVKKIADCGGAVIQGVRGEVLVRVLGVETLLKGVGVVIHQSAQEWLGEMEDWAHLTRRGAISHQRYKYRVVETDTERERRE